MWVTVITSTCMFNNVFFFGRHIHLRNASQSFLWHATEAGHFSVQESLDRITNDWEPLTDENPSPTHLFGEYAHAYPLQGATGNPSTITVSAYSQVLIYSWVNWGTIVNTHRWRGTVHVHDIHSSPRLIRTPLLPNNSVFSREVSLGERGYNILL